jgi:small subunit ribosomal protein S4
MIRKKKRYSRPKKAFETARIAEENRLMKKYALKNKLEIWKTIAKVNYFRKRAMALARSSFEEQEVLFKKLRNLGLKIESTVDVLALKIEDLLERRLPTVVYNKGFAKTPQEARQMVVHKRILLEGKVTDVPSYLVSISEEAHIQLKKKAKPVKVEAPKQEVPAPEAPKAEEVKEAAQ